MHPLIDVAELEERLGEIQLFDIRWALTDPSHGRSQYVAGHIPGAVFVDLDTDLSVAEGDGRHPLPKPEEFGETLGRLGISPWDEVIVYDDMAGAVAARMWWMLKSVGHERVRLLDGGLKSWTHAGLQLEGGNVEPKPVHYGEVAGFKGVVRHNDLDARQVVDVRVGERYDGSVEPVDPKAGHIPGAINIPLAHSLDERRRFRNAQELDALFAQVGDGSVFSCGSGVNACHSALAMTLAGREMPDIYIGSFSDWSRRDLPVATGTSP